MSKSKAHPPNKDRRFREELKQDAGRLVTQEKYILSGGGHLPSASASRRCGNGTPSSFLRLRRAARTLPWSNCAPKIRDCDWNSPRRTGLRQVKKVTAQFAKESL